MLGNSHILAYFNIIYNQEIEVYRVKKIDMGRFRYNNGFIGKCNTGKYYSDYCTG